MIPEDVKSIVWSIHSFCFRHANKEKENLLTQLQKVNTVWDIS